MIDVLHVSFAKEKKRKKREREKETTTRTGRFFASSKNDEINPPLPRRISRFRYNIVAQSRGTKFAFVPLRERERRIHLEGIQIYVAKRNRPHPSQLSSPSDPATLSPRHELPTIYLLCYERHRFSCNSRSEIFSARIASSIAF